MSYKTETIKSYDTFPEAYDKKFEDWSKLKVREVMDRFIANLPPQGQVLDVGAGPGHKAAYLAERGLDVLCIDLSAKMVEMCRKRGLRAEQMDLEGLNGFLPHSFDGILSWTSLLHLPKTRFYQPLQAMHDLLTPKGTLFLGMKEGTTEGWVGDDPRYPDTRRWFSLYTDEELRPQLERDFTIEHFEPTQAGKKTFLNYLLRPKF
jgi:2-polyprenyl-3-methyl-5-hydroxy-6-metoxy-1,4-benzoquinol methylase